MRKRRLVLTPLRGDFCADTLVHLKGKEVNKSSSMTRLVRTSYTYSTSTAHMVDTVLAI